LFRGRFTEADRLIADLKASAPDSPRVGEALTEEARAAALSGQWERCLELSDRGLAAQIAEPSRMVLFQIQGLSHFELGNFSRAKRCLEHAEALAVIFPHGTAALYCRTFRARLAAREQDPDRGFALLEESWTELHREGLLDRNAVQALLRAEIDLCRVALRPHYRLAVAAKAVADAMGERLFSKLGALDCWLASPAEARARFEAELADGCMEFSRVRELRSQIEASTLTPECSTTARAARAFDRAQAARGADGVPEAPEAVATLLFPKRRLALELASGRILDLAPYPQLSRAAELLAADGPLDKERLFHGLWGNTRYSPRLHDPTIRNLSFRMKKNLGIEARTKDGRVLAAGLWLVGPLDRRSTESAHD
jgi:hypothetical protein